ncbi:MAG: hypothetical protein HOM52_16000 [Rhodospirillaceae bacterium]|nr:hypothetical protein [Rhodospirillaceae bacterium]MBT5778428.1 hypothetical protein [Rhodospirillaceae bacterium]MBT6829378.1 hypothetical protein [Rhodospirillaceae bacterium]
MTDKQDKMAHTDLDTPPTFGGKVKKFAYSRDGWTMIAAFAICVISSIFMAGLLPVEDTMSAFGVLFIYFVTMMIIAGMLRMGAGFYVKFTKRGS